MANEIIVGRKPKKMFWFYYRNNLKVVSNDKNVFINSNVIALSDQGYKLFNDIEEFRKRLIKKMSSGPCYPDKDKQLKMLVNHYLSILRGAIYLPTETDLFDQCTYACRSPFRRLFEFEWNDSVVSKFQLIVRDTTFEAFSILQNYALWLMNWCQDLSILLPITYLKHHIQIIQNILNRAAGIFDFIVKSFQAHLPDDIQVCDYSVYICKAYYFQCIAEAAELNFFNVLLDLLDTDTESWELNSFASPVYPKVIANIAREISKNFEKCHAQIINHNKLIAIETDITDSYLTWLLYIEIKALYYRIWDLMGSVYDKWLSVQGISIQCDTMFREFSEIDKFNLNIISRCRKYNKKVKGHDRINLDNFLKELNDYYALIKKLIQNGEKPEMGKFVHSLNLEYYWREINPIRFEFPQFSHIWNNENIYKCFSTILSPDQMLIWKQKGEISFLKKIKLKSTKQEMPKACHLIESSLSPPKESSPPTPAQPCPPASKELSPPTPPPKQVINKLKPMSFKKELEMKIEQRKKNLAKKIIGSEKLYKKFDIYLALKNQLDKMNLNNSESITEENDNEWNDE